MAEMQRYRARTIGVNRFRETLSEPVASRLEQRAKRLRREWGPVRLCRTGRGKRFPRRITPRSALPNGAREAFPSSDNSPFGFAERGEGRSSRATTLSRASVAVDYGWGADGGSYRDAPSRR